MPTRDQQYATAAYSNVLSISKADKEDRNGYGSMSHQLPILIRTAGLAQALAFVEAKSEKRSAYQRLLKDLATTIDSKQSLAERSRSAPLVEYMLLTRQTMDALLWYKRFAQSVLGIDASEAITEDEDKR